MSQQLEQNILSDHDIKIKNIKNLKICDSKNNSLKSQNMGLSQISHKSIRYINNIEEEYEGYSAKRIINRDNQVANFTMKGTDKCSLLQVYEDDFFKTEDNIYEGTVAKNLNTEQYTLLYRLKQKEIKYEKQQQEYTIFTSEIKKYRKKVKNEQLFDNDSDNVNYSKIYLAKFDQNIEKKLENLRSHISKFGKVDINLNPGCEFYLRIGDQAIPLNSNFLNAKEKTEYQNKTPVIVKYSDYYNYIKFEYRKEEGCYHFEMKEKQTNKTIKDQLEDIRKSIKYYQSLNNDDAYLVSVMFEGLLMKLSAPYYNVYNTLTKTYIKKISKKTLKWIKSQKWTLRKYVVGPKTNLESLETYQMSEALVEFTSIYDVKDLSYEKKVGMIFDFCNLMKTNNSINFLTNRYSIDDSLFKKIKKLDIEYPDKIFTEDYGLTFKSLDGRTKKLINLYWTEKYIENNQEFIEKYNVIFEVKELEYLLLKECIEIDNLFKKNSMLYKKK